MIMYIVRDFQYAERTGSSPYVEFETKRAAERFMVRSFQEGSEPKQIAVFERATFSVDFGPGRHT